MAQTATGGVTPAPASLLSRFIGIITSPKATFQTVVAHPRWFWMLLLTTVIVTICTAGPQFTEAGRQAALDQQVRGMESFGMTVNDEMYAQLERNSRFGGITTAVSVLVISPIFALILTTILWAIFNVAFGGDASFKQALAVVVHAGVISTLAQLFTAPLNYVRGTLGSATNMGVLLPMVDEKSFAGRLLGMIDLFMIWYCIVLAMGLAVLYRRRTQPIAIALFVVYAVIAIGFAAIMSRVGGSN
jgi:hypothetical protein